MDKIKGSFWEHNCKHVGLTATLSGEPCNYCDVTEDDIKLWVLTEDIDRDITIDPRR